MGSRGGGPGAIELRGVGMLDLDCSEKKWEKGFGAVGFWGGEPQAKAACGKVGGDMPDQRLSHTGEGCSSVG